MLDFPRGVEVHEGNQVVSSMSAASLGLDPGDGPALGGIVDEYPLPRRPNQDPERTVTSCWRDMPAHNKHPPVFTGGCSGDLDET